MNDIKKVTFMAAAVTALAFTLSAGPQSQPADPAKVNMIFWEKQDWESGGAARRLTLWADGRSEVSLRVSRPPAKPRHGWTATREGHFTIYRKVDALPAEQARGKFAAALAAGILDLKSFPPGYRDGSGTLVGVEIGGTKRETVIPMFLHPDQPDNRGSQNHKTFLAVEKILAEFDSDAIEPDTQKSGK